MNVDKVKTFNFSYTAPPTPSFFQSIKVSCSKTGADVDSANGDKNLNITLFEASYDYTKIGLLAAVGVLLMAVFLLMLRR